ncbi:Acid-sensing ion channel 4 [Exaiptasia diaphana]|nr:Acid-sensing ion channel 4 [Exaiptasia diaphana]
MNQDSGVVYPCKCNSLVKPENTPTKYELIKDFSSYTTLHGLHFTMESGSIWRRIVWGVLICFCAGLLTAQIYINADNLLSREVTISKSLEFSETLPFPAVTICNQNMMRKSQIMGTIAQDYLDQMDTIKIRNTGEIQKDVPSFDVEKFVKKAGHQIEKMINGCKFPGIRCLKTKEFTMATTLSYLYGLCYTFNANASTVKEVSTGKHQGLTLELDAESSEYYGPFSYHATGFKVVLHEPGTFHNIDNIEGFDLSPGFLTSIRIKREKTISLPHPYPSNCGSKKLLNFERYSQPSCLIECKSRLLADKCKCRYVGMVEKGIDVKRFCNSTEITQCIIKTSQGIRYNTSDPQQLERLQAYARKTYTAVTIFYQSMSTDVTRERPAYTLSEMGSNIGGSMGMFLGCSFLTVCELIDLVIMVYLKRRKRKSSNMVRDFSQA